MTCRELAEFLSAYLAGELPPMQMVEFERHLAVCDDCVHYIDTYKMTIELGRAALKPPAAETPPSVPDDLLRAILAARKK